MARNRSVPAPVFVRRVRQSCRNVREFADFEQTFLLAHPLSHLPFKDVQNLFVDRVEMEIVRLPGRKCRAHQQQVLRLNDPSFGQPLDMAPLEINVLGVGCGNKSLHPGA